MLANRHWIMFSDWRSPKRKRWRRDWGIFMSRSGFWQQIPLFWQANFSDATRIWQHLKEPDHCVLTGIALWHAGVIAQRVVTTKVDFTGIPEEEQRAYWDSGEPQDKAGAYAIQGRAALYIRGIEGSYSNVVGLPLAETAALLRQANYPLWL